MRIGEIRWCHRLARGAPSASQIMIGLHFSPSSQGFMICYCVVEGLGDKHQSRYVFKMAVFGE